MKLEKCTVKQFDEIKTFYWDVIDGMKDAEYSPAWTKGIYPTEEYLLDCLQKGTLYALKDGDTIAAAMVVNSNCNDGYAGTKWNVDTDKVRVIHILAVAGEYLQQGIGTRMVKEAISLSQEYDVIRLDVLKGNIPASKLYEGMGFKLIRVANMYYEDTGWTDYLLYELDLKRK